MASHTGEWSAASAELAADLRALAERLEGWSGGLRVVVDAGKLDALAVWRLLYGLHEAVGPRRQLPAQLPEGREVPYQLYLRGLSLGLPARSTDPALRGVESFQVGAGTSLPDDLRSAATQLAGWGAALRAGIGTAERTKTWQVPDVTRVLVQVMLTDWGPLIERCKALAERPSRPLVLKAMIRAAQDVLDLAAVAAADGRVAEAAGFLDEADRLLHEARAAAEGA